MAGFDGYSWVSTKKRQLREIIDTKAEKTAAAKFLVKELKKVTGKDIKLEDDTLVEKTHHHEITKGGKKYVMLRNLSGDMPMAISSNEECIAVGEQKIDEAITLEEGGQIHFV